MHTQHYFLLEHVMTQEYVIGCSHKNIPVDVLMEHARDMELFFCVIDTFIMLMLQLNVNNLNILADALYVVDP